MANEQQWLAFRVAGQTYALHIASVREIVRTPQLTPVPQSPAYVAGVMNLRGHIVPVVDLGKKLNRAVTENPNSRVLVMTLEGKLTGLLVDQASEVLKFASAEIEPSPKIFGNDADAFVAGIAKHRGSLIVLLDATKLLRAPAEEPERA